MAVALDYTLTVVKSIIHTYDGTLRNAVVFRAFHSKLLSLRRKGSPVKSPQRTQNASYTLLFCSSSRDDDLQGVATLNLVPSNEESEINMRLIGCPLLEKLWSYPNELLLSASFCDNDKNSTI